MKSCYETNDEAKSSSKQKEKESSIDASSRESRYFSWSAYSSNCVVYGKHLFAGVYGSLGLRCKWFKKLLHYFVALLQPIRVFGPRHSIICPRVSYIAPEIDRNDGTKVGWV